MKKYAVAVVLLLILVFSRGALALEPVDAEAAAKELAALGLLKGDENGNFNLDNPCNRLHGAVLFTRLLGKEEEAMANPRPYPFTDIDKNHWAAPHIGYLYNQGLAYGQEYNYYGSGHMLPAHFATFCLRSLGYTEGAEHSDFVWSESLNFMVEKGIISGTLRNRLRNTANFTRADAVLLAYATVSAQNNIATDFNIAYPRGLVADEVLADIAAQNNFTYSTYTYEPVPANEGELYSILRQPDNPYDICIIPGYLVEALRNDGLLRPFLIREFGGKEIVITAFRDNPYWRDEKSGDYYGIPLAFEVPLLYYNSQKISAPDWGWLFREAYEGGVYLPANSAILTPLALHYYNLPYNTTDEKKLGTALQLLADANRNTKAYLDENMLHIPQREGALLGVISSRQLPALKKLQEEESVYQSWQAVIPPGGAPANVYYAVMPQKGNKQLAYTVLQALLQKENSAANGQFGGYLPALSGVGTQAYVTGPREACRLLNLDTVSRSFFEQGMHNALLLEAEDTEQPLLTDLEFTFSRQGEIYYTVKVDITKARPELLAKAFQKEALRLGVYMWKEYYDGPDNGNYWQGQLTFADGTVKNCGGYGLPLLWEEFSGAWLKLFAAEPLPGRI